MCPEKYEAQVQEYENKKAKYKKPHRSSNVLEGSKQMIKSTILPQVFLVSLLTNLVHPTRQLYQIIYSEHKT